MSAQLMGAPNRATDRVRFDGVEFDLRTGELWRDGCRAVLPEQLFRVLAILVQSNGSLVSRDELRRALWPDDTFVDFEHGLNAAIKRLREALGDSASAPRFIETIPRRGYRFISTVDHLLRATTEPASALEPEPARDANPQDMRATPRLSRRVALIAVVAMSAAIGVAFRLWLSQPTGGNNSLGSELVRLTSTSGLNIDPALSWDGSLLAFASDRADGTGLDIWIQPVAGGSATRITSDDGDEAEPSFSPDNASIVYAKREAGGIYIVNATGGEPRPLVQVARARMPRFSPDGRWVLYWTGLPVWSVVAGATPHAAGSLEVVPSSGGRPRAVAPHFASARYGVWSPDGRHILFLGERDRADAESALDWYLAPADGGPPVRLRALDRFRAAGVTGVPVPGIWSSDHTVVFASAGEGGSNVWKVQVAADRQSIVGDPERLTFGTAVERSPVVARSGQIVFTSLVENVDVWRVRLDPASGAAAGPMERLTDDAARDRVMNVSDDGRTLAFVSSRTGHDTAWIRDLASRHERQVTSGAAYDARVNRDGSHVALNSHTPAQHAELVDLNRGTVSHFCDGCELSDWSRDGRILVAKGNPTRLLIRDAQPDDERALAAHPAWNLYQGRFSPDGNWVVFQTTNTPTLRQIYVVPARQQDPVPVERWIPVVSDFGIQPSWSPDGRAIYYFSFRDGAFCAWLQPVNSKTMQPAGDPRAVQHLHQSRLRAVAGAIVTNDVRGGYLYMTLTETTANLWTMTDRQHTFRTTTQRASERE